MTPRTPCPDSARLRNLLDGKLPPAEQAELQDHLEACETCLRRLEGLVAGQDSWDDAARQLGRPQPAPDPALRQAVGELAGAEPTADESKRPEGDELLLDFLSPSDKPGHIGRLGHYEVLEVIGRGGMGVVLRAIDESLNRVVAIKVLAPHLATSATARRRFAREAKAAAAVSHEHVVAIYAVDEYNGVPYLVMQYIAGKSLQERLDQGGPLELKEVLRIGIQTAAGLAAAHAQGLIHRDVKPANILLENGVERVKLTDFGLARAIDDASLTQSGVIAGTPQYMAPEQARGEVVDARADLFSLGSVLYAMCTGRPPFRASTAMGVLKRVCDEEPRPLREVNADVPEWLAAIVGKLHAKEPADRFQSAAKVADLLGQHLAYQQQPGQAPKPPSVVPPLASRRPRKRPLWPWLVVAAACLLLMCCLLPVGVMALFWLGWSVEEGPSASPVMRPEAQPVPHPPMEAAPPLDPAQPLPDVVPRVVDQPPLSMIGPYVILAAQGRPQQFYRTLNDAVRSSASGDTIEVRGNGPYVCSPVQVRGKALTIRAAPGSRPVLHLEAQKAPDTRPLLDTDSPLVLEGLVLERQVEADGAPGHPERNAFVYSWRAPVHLANCRLLGGRQCVGLWLSESPACELRNCEFFGADFHAAVDWTMPAGGRLALENCVVATGPHGIVVHQKQAIKDQATIRLTHCTWLTAEPIGYWLWTPIRSMLEPHEGEAIPSVRLAASNNIFDAGSFLMNFVQVDQEKPLDPPQIQEALPRLLSWGGQRNLYPPRGPVAGRFLIMGYKKAGKDSQPCISDICDVAGWKRLWNGTDLDGSQGQAVFPVNVLEKVRINPGSLSPSDFRLSPGSPGSKAGKDSRDLGIDADRVGPGLAYERWKQTADYRQWLNETGQAGRRGK